MNVKMNKIKIIKKVCKYDKNILTYTLKYINI